MFSRNLNFTGLGFRGLFLGLAVLVSSAASEAHATSYYGTAVNNAGKAVGIQDKTTHTITYYNALGNGYFKADGFYGVDQKFGGKAGTFSDGGYSGTLASGNGTKMLVDFGAIDLGNVDLVTLVVNFGDMDFIGSSDYTGSGNGDASNLFKESMKLSTTGLSLGNFTTMGQTGSNFAITGNFNTQLLTMTFSKSLFASYLVNGTFRLTADFFTQIKDPYNRYWFNTSETVSFRVDTHQAAVPEPASMLLLGSGLIGGAAARKRKKALN